MPVSRTAITLPADLLKEITHQSKKAGISRSRYVSNVLAAHLRRRDREQMMKQIAEAYATADPSDEQLLSAAKGSFKGIVDRW